MTPAEKKLLAHFLTKPDASLALKDIAGATGLNPEVCSRVICRMERAGLLSVERGLARKRFGYTKITPLPVAA